MTRLIARTLLIVSVLLIAPAAICQITSSGLSQEEIQARITELANPTANVPDNEVLLERELDRIDDSIAQANHLLSIQDYKDDMEKGDKAKADATAAINEIKTSNCDTDASKVLMDVYKIQSATQFKETILWDSGTVDRSPLNVLYDTDTSTTPNLKKSCNFYQQTLGDNSKAQAILAMFDSWKALLNDSQQKLTTYDGFVTKWLDLLKQRRAALQDKISTRTAAQTISSSLWIIMAVIGVFSIGVIFLVTLFSPSLQMEWVASGQVIQFVTVMILLSVIMALGISGILHENTLGTLLGGIAGYVLAQGVGRAAAREVARTSAAIHSMAPTPPTPTPTPTPTGS